MFFLFSAVMGLSLSTIFLVFTGRVDRAGVLRHGRRFGGLSLVRLHHEALRFRGMGSFLIMGLIGLIHRDGPVNNLPLPRARWPSPISIIGVLIFAGLTAWDTQRLKEMYLYGNFDGETAGRVSVMGALSLYLNFINMFQFLLALMGNRE